MTEPCGISDGLVVRWDESLIRCELPVGHKGPHHCVVHDTIYNNRTGVVETRSARTIDVTWAKLPEENHVIWDL